MAILKRGLTGEPVKILQTKMGVTADGAFGPGTEKALKDYQKAHGLAADGIAGPDTFAAMGLHELILIRQGTSGETVKKLQAALSISADGKFGPGTEKALRQFQSKNGLAADGVAGPRTLAALKIFNEITPDVIGRAFLPEIDFNKAIAESEKAVQEMMKQAADTGTSAPTGATPSAAIPAAVPMAQAGAAAGGRSIWDTIKSVFK